MSNARSTSNLAFVSASMAVISMTASTRDFFIARVPGSPIPPNKSCKFGATSWLEELDDDVQTILHVSLLCHRSTPCLHCRQVLCVCIARVSSLSVVNIIFFFLDSESRSHTSEGKSDSYVSRGTCEMLRGVLQDFPSPSTSRRALTQKKENASVKISTSLKVKTRFTWEPQSVTVQSDSLAGLTNHHRRWRFNRQLLGGLGRQINQN